MNNPAQAGINAAKRDNHANEILQELQGEIDGARCPDLWSERGTNKLHVFTGDPKAHADERIKIAVIEWNGDTWDMIIAGVKGDITLIWLAHLQLHRIVEVYMDRMAVLGYGS